MSGATAGMALGPIGAGVGAVVGGALQGGMTYLGNKEVAEDLANTKRKDAALNARATNSMHDGGYTHTHNQDTVTRIDNDNPFNFKPTFKPEWDFYNEQIEQERRARETKELPGFLKDVYGNEKYLLDKNAMDYSAYTTANRKEVPYDTIAGVAGLGANLVPLAANIASAVNLEEDPGFRYARTGRSYIPDFADERAQLNAVDNAYAGYAGKLASASGGNLGAYRANLVGLGANQAESRMAAFNHANDINRTERKLVNEDIVRAAKEDADYTNQERLDNMQNRAAYMAAKQDYLNSAYEGLGSLGKTIFETNQMSGMTTYDILTGKKKKEQ